MGAEEAKNDNADQQWTKWIHSDVCGCELLWNEWTMWLLAFFVVYLFNCWNATKFVSFSPF